jgi:hypothetical protein
MKPFRWNIHKREQLGRLVSGERPSTYDGFVDDLRRCTAGSVAAAGDARLVFIGRSPESIFDYLSGIVAETKWQRRIDLVNLSLRFGINPFRVADMASALTALREHLSDHELEPAQIASAEYPIAFIDLVASGSTFRALVEHLSLWAEDEGVDVAAVRRRIRIVGITWRKKTSPNTFRWQQHAEWLQEFPRIRVKNVSAPGTLWNYLGNLQAKVSLSHPAWRWVDPTYASPPHHEGNIAALRLALYLYTLGSEKSERLTFSSELAGKIAMRETWCRSLVNQLRSVG